MSRARLLRWFRSRGIPEIQATELKERLEQEPPQLLDVRAHWEWRLSRIEGAVNMPIGALFRRFEALDLNPDRPVVVICLSAHRSIPGVRLLRARGFRDVVQLKGGMLAWWRARLPTVSGR